MVNKKDALEDLKKYNRDLDKYLPGLNFDFLKDDLIFDEEYMTADAKKSSDSVREESFASHSFLHSDLSSLVANNILDVKSELAFLRKNILDNIAGEVAKAMSEQQKQIFKHQSDMMTSLAFSLKETISSSLGEIYAQISSIKKDVDAAALDNKNAITFMETFSNDFSEFKIMLGDLNDFKRRMGGANGFDGITKRVSVIEDRISRIISNNELQLDKFVTILKNNNTKIDAMLDNVGVKVSSGVDGGDSGSFAVSKLDERLNRIPLEEDNLDEGSGVEDVSELKSMTKGSEPVDFKKGWDSSDFKSSVDNIIEVDSKLKKLNSLR